MTARRLSGARPGRTRGAAAAALHPRAQLQAVAGFRAVADAVDAARTPRTACCRSRARSWARSHETHDLLHEGSISIVAETVLPIRHCLLARDEIPLDEIRVVRSHPSALEQCRRLLDRLPNAVAVAGGDDRGRGARDGGVRRSHRGRHRGRRGGGAVRARHAQRRRRRRSRVHALRVDRAVHVARRRPRRRAHGVLVRHRPSPGRAARGDRAVRRGRARSRPPRLAAAAGDAVAATASTPSSRAIRSTRRCGWRCASSRPSRARAASSASTRDARRQHERRGRRAPWTTRTSATSAARSRISTARSSSS